MVSPDELFPGFKVPPVDPSRDLRPAVRFLDHTTPEQSIYGDDDFDGDFDQEREWCATCNNMGIVDCRCGGDLCVCRNHGEIECPDCL